MHPSLTSVCRMCGRSPGWTRSALLPRTALHRLGTRRATRPVLAAPWTVPCKRSHRWWGGQMRRRCPTAQARLARCDVHDSAPYSCKPYGFTLILLAGAVSVSKNHRRRCTQGAQSPGSGSRAASVRSRATGGAQRSSEVSRTSQRPKVRPFVATGLSAKPRRLRGQSGEESDSDSASAVSATAQPAVDKPDGRV